MRGGSFHRPRGKHFSLTLMSVMCMTILLWPYLKKPQVANFDMIVLPTSEEVIKHEEVSSSENKGNSEEVMKQEKAGSSENKDNSEEVMKQEEAGSSENKGNSEEVIKQKEAGSSKNEGNSEELIKQEEAGSSKNKGNSEEVIKQEEAGSSKNKDHSEEVIKQEEVGSSEKKVCNYGKGRWVVDSGRPLYSGLKCKQWLSKMWACRKTDRPDFNYESFRWQPANCNMPEFNGTSFLRRMRDKTIAFVGDSLGRQQFQSLLCMVTGGEETSDFEDVGSQFGLVPAGGSFRPDGWAFRFNQTNTTILYYWSSFLTDNIPLNVSDPTSEVAMHLDKPPPFLKMYLHLFDVLILNTGHHWNRGKIRANRLVMHIKGEPNKDRKLAPMGNAKNFTIFSITRWLDSQLPHHPHLKAFFRTISPRHFFNGEWNTGGSCENTTPLARGYEVKQDESADPLITSAVRGTGIKLLDITALSQLRDEGHLSRYTIKAASGIQDCLHWCLPGVPDTWNEILAAEI